MSRNRRMSRIRRTLIAGGLTTALLAVGVAPASATTVGVNAGSISATAILPGPDPLPPLSVGYSPNDPLFFLH
jgi:hypothetical protein